MECTTEWDRIDQAKVFTEVWRLKKLNQTTMYIKCDCAKHVGEGNASPLKQWGGASRDPEFPVHSEHYACLVQNSKHLTHGRNCTVLCQQFISCYWRRPVTHSESARTRPFIAYDWNFTLGGRTYDRTKVTNDPRICQRKHNTQPARPGSRGTAYSRQNNPTVMAGQQARSLVRKPTP